jgi:nitrous oxide reductase accessory protein NosL
MSKSGRIVLVVAMFAAMAACAKKEEVTVVEPVTVEPTYTGKYK